MRATVLSSLAALLLLVALPSGADAGPAKFRKVPGSKGKALQMRTVAYRGSVNGRMRIEVRNRSKTPQTFEAAGLYFVPKGDPEKAPQRLGAAGPFEVVGGESQAVESLVVAPGASVKLDLHVFCIDSHRPSPSSSTPFAVARRRMPAKLRTTIQAKTKRIVERHKGQVDAAAEEIQSEVWRSRNARWIKLEGERAQERPAPDGRQHRQRRLPPRRRLPAE